MPINTRENGLEDLIAKHLVDMNFYEQDANADYRKESDINLQKYLHFEVLTARVKFENVYIIKHNKKYKI